MKNVAVGLEVAWGQEMLQKMCESATAFNRVATGKPY